jgi:flagellin-like protein
MKMKKAQSEIITTVLLVLIALAAVAIIAVFITNQVRQGAATADAKAQCLKIDLEVTKAVVGATTITVKNNGETLTTGNTMLAIVDGTAWGDTPAVPASLTTGVITGTVLTSGKKVEVGVKLADGTACAGKTVYTVTAA